MDMYVYLKIKTKKIHKNKKYYSSKHVKKNWFSGRNIILSSCIK